MRMCAAVGFDLGDTLCEYAGVPLDWEREYPAGLSAVAARCGCELTPRMLQAGVQLLLRYNTRRVPRTQEYSAEKIFGELLAVWEMSTEYLNDGIAAFFAHFRKTLRVFPEVPATLQALQRLGLRMAVLTDVPYGMPTGLVREDIVAAALPFDEGQLLTSTAIGYRKPHPAGFIALARALGVSCEQLTYVGNERKDIEGANAVGCQSVLVWRSSDPPASWGQSLTIRSLEQLIEILPTKRAYTAIKG